MERTGNARGNPTVKGHLLPSPTRYENFNELIIKNIMQIPTSKKMICYPMCLLLFSSFSLNAQTFASYVPRHAEYTAERSEAVVYLESALKEVEKTFEVSVAYRTGVVDGIALSADALTPKTNAQETLSHLLRNSGLLFKETDRGFFIVYKNPLQERTITGKVTDETNTPIAGVSVTVRGTSTTAATDAEGNYRITVPDGKDSLSFYYIGYMRFTEVVNDRPVINIQLSPDNLALSEVVVTAAGIERKSN